MVLFYILAPTAIIVLPMNITPITPWFTNVRGSRNARRIPPTIVTICTPSCNKKVNVEIDRAIANWKAA